MQELVSIIITTYNREDMIGHAVNSCLQQTYANIEVIVIDDGSKDETRKVLEHLIADNKIQYYYQQNKERAAARNTGLELAKGQYVKFLDSDDFIEKDYVDVCVQYFAANSNCELVHTNCKTLNDDGSISFFPKNGVTGIVYKTLWEYNDISLSAVIMKRSVFEKFGGFDETRSLSGAEDWEYWVRLGKQGCVVGFVAAYVTVIRMHKDNGTMNDIDKIVFSAREGERLLEQKFDIEDVLKKKFDARLTYLQAVYYYIKGKNASSLNYLFKAASKNKLLVFKANFWSLLIKNFVPQKIISLVKQKRA